MEIFMRDISFSATGHQVTTRLAEVFHSSQYAKSFPSPMNFHVRLFKDKKGIRKHSGSGALTLPTYEVGDRFLQEYGEPGRGGRRIIIGDRQIKFSKSRNQIRSDVLESIKHQPYVNPIAMEEREKRDALLGSEKVLISTVQFGWECRDFVFSVEWEKTFETPCLLSLDADRRELRITISQPIFALMIVVRFSQIRTLSVHTYLTEQPVIFLSMDMPPSFESESLPGALRQRLSALPIGDHARVAPYTSLAMRLVCSSRYDQEKFYDLSKIAQLHGIYDFEYPIARRNLFSEAAIRELELWLRHFNWCVSFQIVSLVRSMAVDVQEMLLLVPNIQELIRTKGPQYTASMLRHFSVRAKDLFLASDEMQDETIDQCFIHAKNDYSIQAKSSPLLPTDGSLFEALHVLVTPTTMFLEGPYLERSNRVMRHYDPIHHESFLRVSFVDEGRLQYRFDRDIDGPAFIRSRVGELLLDGLTIARRKFQFLAYSLSALKEHAVWFVKPFRDNRYGSINASTIIHSLGSFHNLIFDPKLMNCPARYAARLSQAFTATDASLTVENVEEIFELKDISTESGEYCFTDGVGTISEELAIDITQELKATRRRARRIKTHTRAFQVRFMGSKGMLSVDYKLKGRAICLRPSMIKFEAPESREIGIAQAFDRPGRYFLNRPLIMLLEGLGVPYEVFKQYQDKAVEETQQATISLTQAARTLETHGLGTSYRLPSVMLGLEKLGIEILTGDRFYKRMLEYAVNHILRALKNNAHIPVPEAWTLVGVADVHKFLKANEIFACVKAIDRGNIYLEGPVLISRSPTIHPGDVQIVHAIGRPPPGSCFSIEALPNTVVFSVLGSRPIPSCLGGGDLDGDIYNLIPLNKIPSFTPSRTSAPAEYHAVQRKTLDRPSTMADVAEFVMEYINSDVVGIIAINWLIIADQSPDGIFDQDCLKLSSLHSDAVDYPKSGQPVALNAIPKLRFRAKPDWNAPETVNPDSANYYQSSRAIGRLFRAIDLPAILHTDKRSRGRRPPRERTIDGLVEALDDIHFNDRDESPIPHVIKDRIAQFIQTGDILPDTIEDIRQIFGRYASELRRICATNALSHAQSARLTEEEAIIGTIAQKSSQPRKRKDMMSKLREDTDILVRGVREGLNSDSDMPLKYLERAWLAWDISRIEREAFGAKSFGWVALGAIFEGIKEIEEAELLESRRMF